MKSVETSDRGNKEGKGNRNAHYKNRTQNTMISNSKENKTQKSTIQVVGLTIGAGRPDWTVLEAGCNVSGADDSGQEAGRGPPCQQNR